MRSQKWGKGCEAAFASMTITSGFGSTCALISCPFDQHIPRSAKPMARQFRFEDFIGATCRPADPMVSCCPGTTLAYGANVGRRFLLQQQFRGLHSRVAMKPVLHDIMVQEIGYREQAHALVMGHPAAHQFVAAKPGTGSRGMEIDGLIEPVGTLPSPVVHVAQVPQCR